MAILNNLDNESPLFDNEPTSLAVKLFTDMCCTSCSCKEETTKSMDLHQ